MDQQTNMILSIYSSSQRDWKRRKTEKLISISVQQYLMNECIVGFGSRLHGQILHFGYWTWLLSEICMCDSRSGENSARYSNAEFQEVHNFPKYAICSFCFFCVFHMKKRMLPQFGSRSMQRCIAHCSYYRIKLTAYATVTNITKNKPAPFQYRIDSPILLHPLVRSYRWKMWEMKKVLHQLNPEY